MVNIVEQEELLSITKQLAQPDLSRELRLLLVAQLRAILQHTTNPRFTNEIRYSLHLVKSIGPFGTTKNTLFSNK